MENNRAEDSIFCSSNLIMRKKDVIMCSIDGSTKSTGVAIWKNGTLYTTLLLDHSDERDSDNRITEMCKELVKDLHKYNPEIVFIEDNYVGRNPKTQKQLCRIQGLVYGWCLINNSYFETMTPSSWRKYIPGFPSKCKRDEAKEYSVNYVQKNYGIICGDDVSDAILIGEAMLKKYE